jgi:hypothetical protein
MRPVRIWTLTNFRVQFENQFYLSHWHKVKEKEFLAFVQRDISVLDYERRFYNLSMFASYYVLTEQYRIERL